jgi:hypothetical protein
MGRYLLDLHGLAWSAATLDIPLDQLIEDLKEAYHLIVKELEQERKKT